MAPRPHPSSLSLSLDCLRIAPWVPPRPPTPRRMTYPQPGTTSLSMAGSSSVDTDVGVGKDIPPVPPVSYWEPDTPSPAPTPTSPLNPFLSPPSAGREGSKWAASPILPASPLSMFEYAPRRDSACSLLSLSLGAWKLGSQEISPRFMNPRTAPLPPTCETTGKGPRSEEKSGSLWRVGKGGVVRDLWIAVHDAGLAEMKTGKESEMDTEIEKKGFLMYYRKIKKDKERRGIVRTRSFHVVNHLAGE